MWSAIWICIFVSSAFAGLEKNFINFGSFVCPRETKALGNCLRDHLNLYIPQLATGVPEYGVPSCEPMVVPSLTVEQATGAIKVSSTYSEVTVRGPSKMKVVDVEVIPRKHQIIVKLHIPELKVKGRYKLKGQVLLLPIEGEGQFSGRYGNIDAVVTIRLGRAHRENSADALSCEQLDVKFHMGSASVNLKNLFGGDGDLGAAMNKFLNENWQKLTDELQAPLEVALRDFLKPLADHVFATLNADDILGVK